jgi:undecaprenyl phosphate-alpha-L-ara4FN deformylase
MARIALKVDVDTLRGTLEGVPRLVEMLARRKVCASFLFSVGPDHTGWALRRVFRRGFLSKVSRTSVVKHYGLRTLAYGVLVPGPDIARHGAPAMRQCRDAGHECGLHAFDHVYWQDNVRARDSSWTRSQMQRGYDRFCEVLGGPPATHGAAGWQANAHAFAQIDDWGMTYASDGRGHAPYRLEIDGHICAHIQLPTTLPTFDELIGLDGVDEDSVERPLLARTETDLDQVFTLHAELEGALLAPAFERLIDGWLAQGHALVPLSAIARTLDPDQLPVKPLAWAEVAGRSGELIVEPNGV